MTSSTRRWRPLRLRGLSEREGVFYKKQRMSDAKPMSEAGESGQAMTEYVVLLFGCMLALLAILMPMSNAIHTYMKSIYFCVSLPFP